MPTLLVGRHPRLARPVLLLLVACLGACPSVQSPELIRSSQPPPPQPDMKPLKVHLMAGQLLFLQQWKALPGDSGLVGTGTRYDMRRQPVGPFNGLVPRDSIALLEVTRTQHIHPAGSAMLGTYTVLAGVVTIACLADPKSCFGSCPTFYVDGDDQRPVAEGFSASVARSLEATDVDDLGEVEASGRTFSLTMRNEALETHFVNAVHLLVAPRPMTGALVRGIDGAFYHATRAAAPESCRAGGEDCATAVAVRDGVEWSTRADPTSLAAMDSMDLIFPPAVGNRALLVAGRQSFVSTYVFYQSLAFAGSHAGDLLAEVERRGTAGVPGAWAMMQRLAQVEVFAGPLGGELRPIGAFAEAGPIATDQQLLPFPETTSGSVHVRLRFARGAWRFDRLGLVNIAPAPQPSRIEPTLVDRDGVPNPIALARLVDPAGYLITEPGDHYRLTFELPEDAKHLAFFLESRGYYYEWMRPEWLREENLSMLATIAAAPEEALRRMGPGYARLEPQLDSLFWASRFGRR